MFIRSPRRRGRRAAVAGGAPEQVGHADQACDLRPGPHLNFEVPSDFFEHAQAALGMRLTHTTIFGSC